MTALKPEIQRTGSRPIPVNKALRGPLKARIMNQAKERKISDTQSGMMSNRKIEGAVLGSTTFAKK